MNHAKNDLQILGFNHNLKSSPQSLSTVGVMTLSGQTDGNFPKVGRRSKHWKPQCSFPLLAHHADHGFMINDNHQSYICDEG